MMTHTDSAVVATMAIALLSAACAVAERFEAQRSNAVITEVHSPHAVPVVNPKAVVDVIEQAAGA
jgi:hypothetical protein